MKGKGLSWKQQCPVHNYTSSKTSVQGHNPCENGQMDGNVEATLDVVKQQSTA